jgi:Putative beta barrel porin-7 (BBP7)
LGAHIEVGINTMMLNRTFLKLAVGLLTLLMCASAIGQDLEGMQLFAPADVSSYGRGPQPNEGFFFVYDLLYWTISTPRVSTVGKEGRQRFAFIGGDPTIDQIVQHNTLDTGDLLDRFDLGNRIEFGRIYDNSGWMISYYQLTEQSQSVPAFNVDMVFNEVTSGTVNPYNPLDGRFVNLTPPPATNLLPLPVTFTNVLLRDDTSSWGIELDYVGRSNQLHNGGFFEWYLGPRYIEFDDTFLVNAQGSTTLGNSDWITEAQNHIIAGQLGARWFKKLGRWMLSTEGRGLVGLNCQNVHQTGTLGVGIVPGVLDSNQPFYMGPTNVVHNEFIRQFTPGLELRLDARYQITRSVTFRAGWTGLWLNNVARGAEMVDYTLDPTHSWLGILRDHNKDNVLMNGLTIGIDINR